MKLYFRAKKFAGSFLFFLLLGNFCFANPTQTSDPSKEAHPLEKSNEEEIKEIVPNPVIEEEKDKFNLTYFEPMYFIYGNPTSRVNFSFKYQGIRRVPLYLGYVQNIFWLLREDSKPFRDANFNPSVFYRYSFSEYDEQDHLDIVVYDHKSNGKSEPESRSINGSGAKINWRFEYENWSLKTHAKAMWRYKLDRTNKDFEDYVGPFEIGVSASQFSFDWLDKLEISYRFYSGGKWGQDLTKGGHEAGLAFRFFGSDLTPAFYVQYFNGYSESLLNYNKREENFRIGFML